MGKINSPDELVIEDSGEPSMPRPIGKPYPGKIYFGERAKKEKSKMVRNVRRFHHAKGCLIDEDFTIEHLNSRVGLVAEEFEEFAEACLARNNPGYTKEHGEKVLEQKILREMVDIVYTLIGTAATFGWDFDKAWDSVHAANMEKTDEQVEGKVVKPEDWVEPDLTGTV